LFSISRQHFVRAEWPQKGDRILRDGESITIVLQGLEEDGLRFNRELIHGNARVHDECNILHIQPPSRHVEIQEYFRNGSRKLIG